MYIKGGMEFLRKVLASLVSSSNPLLPFSLVVIWICHLCGTSREEFEQIVGRKRSKTDAALDQLSKTWNPNFWIVR